MTERDKAEMKQIADVRVHSRGSGRTAVMLILLSCFSPTVGLSQTEQEINQLRDEITKLHEKQDLFQKELQAIKARLLPSAVAVEPVERVIDIVGSPSKGDKNAELILVEFSDYQCPFCARHFRETMPRIENDYIKTGKIRYIFRDFPIEAIHPGATKRHVMAHCAGEQDKYWNMHDLLFGRQKQAELDLPEYAQAAGMDTRTFLDCVENEKYADTIRHNFADGQKVAVRGTPSFFVGFALPNGSQMQSMWMIRGAVSYSVFRDTIEKLLWSRKPQASIR
jgi:protein-disulfide isomerase